MQAVPVAADATATLKYRVSVTYWFSRRSTRRDGMRRLPGAEAMMPTAGRTASEQIFNYTLSPEQKQVAVVLGRMSSAVVLISTTQK